VRWGQPRWVRAPERPAPLPGRHPVPVVLIVNRPRLATPDPHPASRVVAAMVEVAEVAEATSRAEAEVPHPADPHPAVTDPAVPHPPDPHPAVTDPVDRATTDPADPVDRATKDPADPVDRATTDPADRATTVPECAGPAGLVTTVPAVPAALGMAMTIAATSTAPPGETDPHLGVQASRRIPTGADRFPRRVDGGEVARSTTTATTKTRCGTRGSTSGASTSSESGSRCKESPRTTPASPIGEAGVLRMATHNCIQVEMRKICPIVMRRI
jgi:hypothetical protein